MRSLSFQRVNGTPEPVITQTGGMLEPTGAEVVVKVTASSINGSDINLRHGTGLMALITSRTAPGFDIAGQVVSCGEEVTAFEVGDRVMGLLGHSGGGQSDYVVVAQRRLALVPADLPDVAAAALPLAGLTALQALRTRGHLRAGIGGKVLINGAAGGIGSFAVQLAKLSGAHVTAVTSGDRHNYLQGLGADHTVNRDDDTMLRSGQDFDLVFDVPGVLRFTDVRAALNSQGVLVSTRPITTDALRLAGPSMRSGSHTTRYAAVMTKASSQDLSYLARLVHEGRLTVPVNAAFPLAEASAAYAHAESGELKGKVVLTL